VSNGNRRLKAPPTCSGDRTNNPTWEMIKNVFGGLSLVIFILASVAVGGCDYSPPGVVTVIEGEKFPRCTTTADCGAGEVCTSQNLCLIPGEYGADGVDGQDGADGAPGADGVDGQDGADGAPGADGVDGQDGADGAPGADGQDGQSFKPCPTEHTCGGHETCSSNGVCVPKPATTPPVECESGIQQSRACGLNDRGIQYRSCVSGNWTAWGQCYDSDTCLDNHSQSEMCTLPWGATGWRNRTCHLGSWLPWGECFDPQAECTTDHDCDDGDDGTQDTCVQGECVYTTIPTPPVCRTLHVATGWIFQGAVGPLTTEGWPEGEWVSCPDFPGADPETDVRCRSLTVCEGESAMFNVQSVPAQQRAWAIEGSWSGTNWCGSPNVDSSMFVGTTPAGAGCSVVCTAEGYLNWLCQF